MGTTTSGSRTWTWARPTIAVICLIALVGLTLAVALHHGPLPGDLGLELRIQRCSCTGLDPVNALLGWITGPVQVGAAVVVLAAVAIWRRPALGFALATLIASGIYNAIAYAVRRPRPHGVPHMNLKLGSLSFPSGHVVFFTWLAVLAIVLMWARVGHTPRVVAIGVACAWIMAVSVSRIYTGSHWPSDVLGGLLLAAGWTAASLSARPLVRSALGAATPRSPHPPS